MGKTSKAEATSQYFPTVTDRIGTKINLISKLTAVLSGHGKTKAYLHRFNLWEDAKCICNKGDQTMDILFQCVETNKKRPDKTPPKNTKELAGKQIRANNKA